MFHTPRLFSAVFRLSQAVPGLGAEPVEGVPRRLRARGLARCPRFLEGIESLCWTHFTPPMRTHLHHMSRQINRDVGPVTWLAPGPAAGLATLQTFVETRLKDFGDKRNDPNNDCLSNLSPYLHFGQVRRPPMVVSHSNSFG